MEMLYYQKKSDAREIQAGHGHGTFPLLNENHGCTGGCCAGISYYASTEYTPVAVHDDQEGFIVLSGKGWAKIGGQEFPVEKDTAFIAPAGTAHQMRTVDPDEPLTLFWFHARP